MKIFKITADGLILNINFAAAHKELRKYGINLQREAFRDQLKKNPALKLSSMHGEVVYTTDPDNYFLNEKKSAAAERSEICERMLDALSKLGAIKSPKKAKKNVRKTKNLR